MRDFLSSKSQVQFNGFDWSVTVFNFGGQDKEDYFNSGGSCDIFYKENLGQDSGSKIILLLHRPIDNPKQLVKKEYTWKEVFKREKRGAVKN
jgi:hypothetical protein